MIPKVRTWKVSFYVNNKLKETLYVDTINKDFARYLVRHAYWKLYAITSDTDIIKTTVSLAREVK